MLTKPVFVLRLEGASIFILSIFFYRQSHASWPLFAMLFLSPDVLMPGYLVNARIGAALYNLVHTILAPSALIAHIGLDRMLGYGLKYRTRFKDTHLQHV